MSLPAPPKVVVTVAPTSTEVFYVDVRPDEWATVQVDNLDATQTFVGTIERKVSEVMSWSPSTIGDFSGVGPLGSVTVDLDVSGTGFLRLVGTMSGAGGDVSVAVRKGHRK